MEGSNLKKKNNLKTKKKIFKLINLNYEKKLLFITFKFFKQKQKKKKIVKPVQYLKTSRYVIPLPSEENDVKKWWIKNQIEFGDKLYLIFDKYNFFFKNSNGYFIAGQKTTYTRGKASDIPKFDYGFKFDILRVLHQVYCIISQGSFYRHYLWKQYSYWWFKFFSILFFWDMFQKYWSPNLPLLKWKGDNYTPEQEGWMLLKSRNLIFKQLFYESIDYQYKFSEDELNIFNIAGIDPFDKWYFWPTRRLFLLGVSEHDGRIAPETQIFFFKKFSDIPQLTLRPGIILSLKKRIVAQFLYWWQILIDLLLNNKLLFNYWCNDKIDLYYKTIYHKDKTFRALWSEQVTAEFLLHWTQNEKNLTFLTFPIPDFYIGNSTTFVEKNYLFSDIITNNNLPPFLDLLKESNEGFFLKKLVFTDLDGLKKEFSNFYKNLSFYKYDKKNIYKLNVINKIYKLKKNFFFNLDSKNFFLTTPQSIINYFLFEKEINKLKKKTKTKKEYVYPLPEFLKNFFFLLLLKNPSVIDIDNFCIDPFLPILPDFILEKKKAEDEVLNFIGPLQVFKQYFEYSNKYNLNDPTIAYKVLKDNLKLMPNKDWIVWWLEPYGLNPFFEITKILTKKDVPFPEAVTPYTFFSYLQKKFDIPKKKSKSQKIPKHIELRLLTFCSNWNNFFYFFKLLWFVSSVTFSLKTLSNTFIETFKINNLWYFKYLYGKTKKSLPSKNIIEYQKIWNEFLIDLETIETGSSLDFLKQNPINFSNYTAETLKLNQNEAIKKIWTEMFVKLFEKQKSRFLFSTMYSLLKLSNTFKTQESINSLLLYHYWYNSFISKFFKFKHSNLLYLYVFNSFVFFWLFFMIKFFFENFFFDSILKLKK